MHALGYRVFAGVRRTEDGAALERKAGSSRMIAVRLDVTDAEQVAAAAERVDGEMGARGLAGLVNNAGMAIAGPLEFLPIAEVRGQLEVNVLGQLAVTQALLPAVRRARGRIVFMSSIAGRSAMPFTGPYAASKFALEALADAWRVELRGEGIEVCIVEPGVIGTPIWETSLARADRTLRDMPAELSARYGRQLTALRRIVASGNAGPPPGIVAEAVAHALTARRPRTRYLIGRDARLRLILERLIPTRLRDRIIAARLRRL
jgi:NAD(P)-dependent dehydrogenase (short-subunit alcohol dehydrogenase family)